MRAALILLAIDTCLSALTLGLKRENGEVVSVSEEIGIGHAERIAPAFAQLMEQAGARPQHLTRIGVTVGPGSFMGQRVGIAFAKGLVMGTGAQTVPLTTLQALAQGQGEADVAIDARRGQVYFQSFGGDGAGIGEPDLLTYEDAAARLSSRKALGSGIAVIAPKREVEGPLLPAPEALLALAAERPAAPLRTLYLRAPDAKPPSRPPL